MIADIFGSVWGKPWRCPFLSDEDSWVHPTDIPLSEALALKALYEATSGPSWTVKTGWGTDTDIGNWHGIQAWAGHVRKVMVVSNNMTGAIPAEIGDLTELSVLSLWGNQLTGSIPAEIGDLVSLTNLTLSSNPITGSLPGEIAALTSLETLLLYSTYLSGVIPTGIGAFTELTRLALFSTSYSAGEMSDFIVDGLAPNETQLGSNSALLQLTTADPITAAAEAACVSLAAAGCSVTMTAGE